LNNHSPKQQKSMTGYTTVVWGILLILLIIIVPVIIWYVKDVAPPNTDDLKVKRVHIPKDQNAFTFFEKAINSAGEIADNKNSKLSQCLKGAPYNKKKLEKKLKQKQTAFDQIKLGLRCSRLQLPEHKFADNIDYLKPLKNISILLCEKAMLECDQEKYSESIATTDMLMKFNIRILKKSTSIITWLCSLTGIHYAIMNYRKLACSPISDVQLKQILINLYQERKSLNSSFIHVFKYEFNMSIKMLEDTVYAKIKKGKTKNLFSAFVIKQNETKLLYANHCRELIKHSSKPFKELKTSTHDKIKKVSLFYPNSMGRIIFVMFTTTHKDILKHKYRTQCRLDAVQLQIACKLYKRKNGKYPERLQQLVPEFLESIPVDPFDGKSFRYSFDKQIVYSVGPDLKDSGCTKSGQPLTRIFDYRYKPREDDKVFSIEDIRGAVKQ
jgi:hypothetical protein